MANQQGMRKLKRAVIKEELVALTGDAVKALLLNQLLYWTERAWDFDQFIEEEKARAERNGRRVVMPLTRGWITKTADQLSEELMIGLSKSNIRRHILYLVERGWVQERENPDDRWSRTKQYRVNLIKIREDLARLGYPLEGFAEDRLTHLSPAGGPDPDRGPDGGRRGSKIEPRQFEGPGSSDAGSPSNEGSSILEPRGAEIEPHGFETAPARVKSPSVESRVEEILSETKEEIRDVVCVSNEAARQKVANSGSPLSPETGGQAGGTLARQLSSGLLPGEARVAALASVPRRPAAGLAPHDPPAAGAWRDAAGRQGSPCDGLGSLSDGLPSPQDGQGSLPRGLGSLPGELPGPGHGLGGGEKSEEAQGDPGGGLSVAGGPEVASLALLLASKFSLADGEARTVAASLLSRYSFEAVVAKLPVAAAEGRIRNLAAYLSQAIEEDWHPPVEVGRRRSRGKPAAEEKPGWRDDKYADLYLS